MKTLFMVVHLEWKWDANANKMMNPNLLFNTGGLKHMVSSIPSEKKQRRLSAYILGDNLESEAAQFTFPLRHGDLRPAPLVFVPDLVALVFQYLE